MSDDLFPTETFTRQQVHMLTGVEDDVLGFWIKQGLLRPLPAAPRAHRRFGFEQLHIAVILNAMRSLGANVGILRKFADGLQRGLIIYREADLDSSTSAFVARLASALCKFRAGQRVTVLSEDWDKGPSSQRLARDEQDIIDRHLEFDKYEGERKHLVPLALSLNSYEAKWLDIASDIVMKDILSSGENWSWVWLAWVDSDGDIAVNSGENGSMNISLPMPRAAFYLSVSQLIRPLWPDQAKAAEQRLYEARQKREIERAQALAASNASQEGNELDP